MRYDDWDILLFQQDCKVPIKEFKVACHVVHDTEFAQSHGSYGLPTITCFVPSLPAGTPFQVSIHSWSLPAISQFTRSYTKFPETVKFEARLFIDGRLIASTSLDRKTTWPHVIANSFDFSKNGDLIALKFPAFRQELLQQNYWSPADDLGRIKVIISEGFPRDSLSLPIERVKNIAAFSFQHAPLDILESSSIAWPNPSMWRRAPFTASMPVPSVPSLDAESHAHSPRRKAKGLQDVSPPYIVPIMQSVVGNTGNRDTRHHSQPTLGQSALSGGNSTDPFTDPGGYFEWMGGAGMGMSFGDSVSSRGNCTNLQPRYNRRTSTDISMPDYPSTGSGAQMPMIPEQHYAVSSSRHDEDGQVGHWKVPANTPTAQGHADYEANGVPFPLSAHNSYIPTDLANTLTSSLLNQQIPPQLQSQTLSSYHPPAPASEVRSRKENRFQPLGEPSPSTISTTSTSTTEQQHIRKVSHQLHLPLGSAPSVDVASQENSPQRMTSQDFNGPAVEDCVLGSSLAGAGHALNSVSGNTMDKGIKRLRDPTSTSAKVLEGDDEPLRPSPSLRLASFVADSDGQDKQ